MAEINAPNGKKKKNSEFFRVLDKVLEVTSVVLLANIIVLMSFQIVMRYVFDSPPTWTEEIMKYSLVWLTFIGSVLAVRDKAHVLIDAFTNKLPAKLQRVVLFLSNCLSILFLSILVIWGFRFARMNLSNYSLITKIPRGMVFSVIPVSAFLMILYFIRSMKEEK
ncbi:putative TRAP dicarboxylate transporter DctQ subunit [uncultured spirochete]|uniref:Putative TRAP dicarboxylate transporter DctQ subunit n=1 Tax=uncultured spirochete TaxID=156406 RepID=A0A3P3XP44_9SPIR|nr:putative TRAP dicarboxylate transporter DctQ subunit [uncultured spirochete]